MGSSNETSAYGPAVSPWRRPGDNRGADARRLVRRLGGGGRGGPLPRRDRHRHRRLDPPAGGLHRHRRGEADLRALLALGDRRLRLVARPGRADGEDGARRRDHARGDGRARPEGLDLRRCGRCPISRRRSWATCAASASASRASTGSTGCRPRSRRSGSPGAEMAARRGGGDRRHLAAAHEVRAARLLRDRARGGVVEPRALRRGALRAPGEDRRRTRASPRCTSAPAPRASAPR